MNENDVKAILWLLKEINEDKIIASYFRANLNLYQTDIAKLIIEFEDIVKMLNNSITDELNIPIQPNVVVTK